MSKVQLTINQKGFSLVEALLTASVFGILVTAVIGGIAYGHEAVQLNAKRNQANLLAEEGTEAVRNIRDAAFSNLSDGTYGLTKTSNKWTLSGTQDTSGIYTRQIIITTPAVNRKQIVSRVTWQLGSKTYQTESTTTLTNWLAAMTFAKNWSTATLSNTVDLTGAMDGLKAATKGNYLYVVRSDGSPDFMIINVTDPAVPVVAGSLSLSGAPTNIFIKGDYVYVSASDTSTATTLGVGELKVINVSNPLSPSVVGSINLPGVAAARSVYVNGNYAYMGRLADTAVGSNEFQVINVTAPESPTLTGVSGLDVAGVNFADIYVNNSVAYAATSSDTQELYVVDVSSPALPTAGMHKDVSTTANVTATDAIAITGYGSNIFLTQGNTFHSMTTESALSPTVRGKIALTANGNDLTVNKAESLVYAATDGTNALLQPNNEFQVINTANPASPTVMLSINLPDALALPINGVAFSITKNRVFGLTSSDTQEILVFTPG